MTRQGRISVLVLSLLCLLYFFWMFFATTQLGDDLSGLTHSFLDIVLYRSRLQPGNDVLRKETTSNISEATQNSTSVSDLAQWQRVFAKIYVVSLPHRADRRVGMDRVRQVIGLNWTYFDAAYADSPPVTAIIEQAVKNRAEQSANPWYPVEFSWPLSLSLPEFLPGQYKRHTQSLIPAPSSLASPLLTREVWRDPVGQEDLEPLPLTCATGNKTFGPPYDRTLPPHLILSPPRIACWYSHTQVLRQILESSEVSQGNNGTSSDDTFLVLEDDIDIERDFHLRVQEVWNLLPSDWDMVFLGHCWSNETYWPALNATLLGKQSDNFTLHPSYAPKCTHAYAISRRGAARLLAHLSYPPFAYSRALDQAYSWLIQTGRLRSYSLVPSIVIQRKVSSSDVDPGERGVGSKWREHLVNGVF